MKLFQIKWAVLGLGALMLAACSSGSGSSTPGSSLSITTTDAAGVQSTFVATTANTVFSAHTSTTENKTIIEMCSDVDKDNDCSKMLVMTIEGTTAQKYSMDSASVTQINWHDDDPEESVTDHYLSTSGEVEVESIDDSTNGSISGTMNATLECNSGCSGNATVTGKYVIVLNQQ